VALPRNVVDLTVNIPPNVQNITVTVPKRLSGKLNVSPKSDRSTATDRYGSRSGSNSTGSSPHRSPVGQDFHRVKDHSILGSMHTSTSTSHILSPVIKIRSSSPVPVAPTTAVTGTSTSMQASPKAKSPSRPAETDASREHRPHRKRKFFPSALNVLSLMEAAQNSADTGSESTLESISPLPSKMGRQGVTPKHSSITGIPSSNIDCSEPAQSHENNVIAAPEGTVSSFFKHAVQVLEPEAVSPGRKLRVVANDACSTVESVSTIHSESLTQQNHSVNELTHPTADRQESIDISSHGEVSAGDNVLYGNVPPPRSFAAQVAHIESHVQDILSSSTVLGDILGITDTAVSEPVRTVHVIDELLDDFDLEKDKQY